MTVSLASAPESATRLAGAPLGPMQRSMLAAHVGRGDPGIDVEQIVCTLCESVDPAALERAWCSVVDANDALRAAIDWRDAEEPRQIVAPDVTLPFEWRSARGLDIAARDETIARFLTAERLRGFDLAAPPLMRLALFEFADEDWRLVWTFHHIILDGRAFAIVLEDVLDAYDAEVRGASATPPRRATRERYADWAATRDPETDLAFWRSALRGVVAPTPLPLRVRAPRTDVPTAADHDVHFPCDATRSLRACASAHGVSLGTLVHAAWALVLARYARTHDVVFGVVAACDDYPGADANEPALGVCINSVPLRLSVRDDSSVGEWLRDVRAQWLAVRAHKHAPLAAIQERADLGRGVPLFGSLVMYDRYELDERLRARGRGKTRRFRLYEQNGFPLTIGAYGGDALMLRFEYDPRELHASDVEILARRVSAALAEFSRDSLQRVADVALSLPGERERVVEEWNATRASFDPATLPEMIAAQVARTPDAPAVVADNVTLSYAELAGRAGVVARYLAAHGVGPGSFVGVCVPRSEHLVAALVGIVQSGAAYVPLDPDYPAQRLAHMRDDAGLGIVLATAATARLVLGEVGGNIRVVELDTSWGDIEALASTANAAPRVATLDDAAYMIYTSGSTGLPKGALNSHRGIANRLLWMQREYALDARDAVLQKTPASFDVSVWEFFWPLITGARLVLAAPGGHRDPAYLRDLIVRERVSVLHFVPSMLRAFLEEEDIARCSSAAGGALRDVMCSGEALPFELQERFFERIPGVRLHNLYGPTEAAVDVTAWQCVPRDPRGAVPIGRPIANTRVYVLDEARHPVPVGVPGELYIGGVQVGIGYWRRPELTSERFLDDPFVGAGARMYRTGDLARWSDDGVIDYLGRIDDQVKIRGQRVELGEIEAVLAQQPEVSAAFVALRDDPRGVAQLVAYCVPASGAAASAEARPALRDRLARVLPSHMLPAAIVWIDTIPLGVTGKLDRRALPTPVFDDVVDDAERVVVAPQSSAEATVAAIFAELLGVERVGRDEDFFRLGGDSILLIRAVSAARRAGIVVSLREVAASPTVASFAAAARDGTDTAAPAASAVPAITPLTPVQRWFFETSGDERDHWNQAIALRPRESLNDDVLRAAVIALIERHAALRSRFAVIDGAWVQETIRADSVQLDFDTVDADAQSLDYDATVRQVGELAQRALSIERGVVVAVRAIRSATRGDLLLIVAHHLVVDGVSWRIIVEDLESLCVALREQCARCVAPVSATFGAWSLALARVAEHGGVGRQAAYWRDVVAAGTSKLMRDFVSDTPSIAASTRTVLAGLSAETTQELLRNAPRALDTHVNAVLLGALAHALSGRVASDHVVLDVEGHGREQGVVDVDVARSVGWFTSIYPVSLGVTPGIDAVARVRDVAETLRMIPERGVGYGVLRYLRGDTTVAGAARDVVFNYLGQTDRDAVNGSLFDVDVRDIGALRGPRTPRRHLLEVNCAVRGGRFEAAFDYDATLLDFTTVTRIGDRFTAALREIAESTRTEQTLAVTRTPQIEASYQLTPLQRLFHAFDGADRDPGLQQWRFRIEGTTDASALRAAWETIVGRHSILRTAFTTHGGGDVRQTVYRHVVVPWNDIDLRTVPAEDRDAALQQVLERDRALGLRFDAAPLMRITLVRLGDAEHELIWTHHHAALDRWSWLVVLEELAPVYAALRESRAPSQPPAPKFRAYVDWLARQDSTAAERFWRTALAELPTVPRLRAPDVASPLSDNGETVVTLRLERDRVRTLRALAASMATPLNSVLLFAWSLTLSHLLGSDDLVVGIVDSGRPDDLDESDRIVGAMVANVPLRVRVSSQSTLAASVRDLTRDQFDLRQHAWAPLDRIEGWSGRSGRLFETLIVFQDASADVAARAWVGADATVTNVVTPTRTEFPVTLVVGGDDEIVISLHADPRRVVDFTIRRALPILNGILSNLSREEMAIADILATLSPLERGKAAIIGAAAEADSASDEPEPQRGALEQVLVDMWRDVLGVRHVRIADTFFALGGNSLAAMKLSNRIAELLRVRLPLRALFAAPTIEQLAEAVRVNARQPGAADRIAELVLQVSGMSDGEVGSTLSGRQSAAVTGIVE